MSRLKTLNSNPDSGTCAVLQQLSNKKSVLPWDQYLQQFGNAFCNTRRNCFGCPTKHEHAVRQLLGFEPDEQT